MGFTPFEMFPLRYYHKTIVADNDIKTRTKNIKICLHLLQVAANESESFG